MLPSLGKITFGPRLWPWPEDRARIPSLWSLLDQEAGPRKLYNVLDLRKKGNNLQASIELPGFSKENISVDIVGSRIHVMAKQEKASADPDEVVLHYSAASEYLSYAFDVPIEVDLEASTATLDQGILVLTLVPVTQAAPGKTKLLIQ